MVLIAVPMADGGGGGAGITFLLPLILIVGMIWFMSRTQRKQRQRQAAVVAALNPGTRVLTNSGQVGVVQGIDGEFVTLEIAPGVDVQFVRQSIGRVLDDPETALGDDEEFEDEEFEDEDLVDEELDEDAETAAIDEGDEDLDRPAKDRVGTDKPKPPPTHTEN